MAQMFFAVFFWLILIGLVIPIFVGWLVIKYFFRLRQRQNDQFLDKLGYVVRGAVIDALQEWEDIKKHGKKTSWATFNSTKGKND